MPDNSDGNTAEKCGPDGGLSVGTEDRSPLYSRRAASHEQLVRECLLVLGASPTAVSNLICILAQSQLGIFWKNGEVYFENFGSLKWEPGEPGQPSRLSFEPSEALLDNAARMKKAWEAERFLGSMLFEKRLHKLT